jgi:hypothetical protein
MEAFFAITLSIFLISKFGRSKTKRTATQELNRNTVKARWDRKRIKSERLKQEEKLTRKADRQREKQKQKDIELISLIIPTINNDK